jgi:hypothetical protein
MYVCVRIYMYVCGLVFLEVCVYVFLCVCMYVCKWISLCFFIVYRYRINYLLSRYVFL